MGTKKGRAKGVVIPTSTMVENSCRQLRRKKAAKSARFLSTSDVSLVRRLMILPVGVTWKKDNGALQSTFAKCVGSFLVLCSYLAEQGFEKQKTRKTVKPKLFVSKTKKRSTSTSLGQTLLPAAWHMPQQCCKGLEKRKWHVVCAPVLCRQELKPPATCSSKFFCSIAERYAKQQYRP